MSRKHILMAGVALMAMTASLPAFAAEEAVTHHGLYAGAFGGYGWTDLDVAGPDFNVDGADYGAFAGYQMDALFGRSGFSGAIEGFYGWSSADDGALEKNHEWGVNFRPGLTFLDNTMDMGLHPYAILGYRRAEFQTAAGDNDFDGFELGVGTEVMAYDQVGVRLDYSHVFYKDDGGVDPDENDLRAGLVFHF